MTLNIFTIGSSLAMILSFGTACTDSAATNTLAALEGDYVMTVHDIPAGVMEVPDGFRATKGEGVLRLTGSAKSPTSGWKTGGISFRLPEEVERQASGKTATVTIYGASEGNGEVWVAYSTNEVGNSHWRNLGHKPDSHGRSFKYKVPVAKDFRGDFIGILPDPNGRGTAFELKAIAVDIE